MFASHSQLAEAPESGLGADQQLHTFVSGNETTLLFLIAAFLKSKFQGSTMYRLPNSVTQVIPLVKDLTNYYLFCAVKANPVFCVSFLQVT